MESFAQLCRKYLKRTVTGGVLATAILHASSAHANLQPGSLYDARSAGMNGTGVAFLDSGAASFHNPALMDKIARSATTLTFSPFLNNIGAPIPLITSSGEQINQETTGFMFAPLGQLGTAWRVHPNVVVGANALVIAGDGIKYHDVLQPGYDFSLQFIQAELQIPFAFKLTDGLSVGIAYRMTLGTLSANVPFQNPAQPGTFVPATVSATAGNFTGVQAGIHYQPIPELELGVNYRNQIRLNWSGSAKAGPPGQQQDVPAQFADPAIAADDYDAPHELGGGIALHLLNNDLLISLEYRHFFYSKAYAPLGKGWDDAYNYGIGAEYMVTPMVPVRLGFGGAHMAPNDATATFEGVPPGNPLAVSAGTGVNLGEWAVDLAAEYSWYSHTVSPQASNGTGIPGDYSLKSIEIFLSGTYKF